MWNLPLQAVPPEVRVGLLFNCFLFANVLKSLMNSAYSMRAKKFLKTKKGVLLCVCFIAIVINEDGE